MNDEISTVDTPELLLLVLVRALAAGVSEPTTVWLSVLLVAEIEMMAAPEPPPQTSRYLAKSAPLPSFDAACSSFL